MVEFQWFLILLSVRPGRNRAMTAHLLPNLGLGNEVNMGGSNGGDCYYIEEKGRRVILECKLVESRLGRILSRNFLEMSSL